ncbi:MAG: M48 family metalloprotease [Granulosicoccus sp.]|nr:M48 family metalloprotease [Granulosicoccus sp.]
MEYENRLPPEGINTSRQHPLKQFLQLVIGALVLVVMIVAMLQVSGSFLARKIPFSYELAVMQRLNIPLGDARRHADMTAYLNGLASRVGAHMAMPEDMQLTVHYDDDEVFNAFATVGGNLLFYRGLLSRMPDENTLAMVMAHEIAHVLHRDPVAALGGGVASTIALLALTGNSGTGMAGQLLNNAGMLTSIQFTRRMEVAADRAALAAVNGLYGHVNGAARLFELFRDGRDPHSQDKEPGVLERFVSTHPLDAERISNISRLAVAEHWQQQGELTPLPADFKRWLER